MAKRGKKDDSEQEKKAPLRVFYFDCSCGLTVTGDSYPEVQRRGETHQIVKHTINRPDSRMLLRAV